MTRVGLVARYGVAVALCALILSGCAVQRVHLPALANETGGGRSFENSGYTWYVLFDLVPVREVTTDQLIAEVNPEKLPIESLEVTSEQDFFGVLLNLLNGGIIDRGVIVSLNKVSVKGRFGRTK
jgi:hypothetical protein